MHKIEIIHAGWLRNSKPLRSFLIEHELQIEFHQLGSYDKSFYKDIVIDHGSVKQEKVEDTLKSYTYGFIDYSNDILNERLCAPVKIFEYIRMGIIPVTITNKHIKKYWFKILRNGISMFDLLTDGGRVPNIDNQYSKNIINAIDKNNNNLLREIWEE
ncbi:hypothetical protein OAE69_03340 [Gammaproteobacteria bacterium]|nr:hypothetical protein [Gammaproteobacteria bacterium]